MCGESDCWSRIPLLRLGQNLLRRRVRQLANDLSPQMFIRQDPNAFGWNQRAQPLNRVLNQRLFTDES
jgi:hypothetical protein